MKTPAQPNSSSSRRRSAEAVDRSQDQPFDSNTYCCGSFLGHAFGDLCFAFQLLCWAADCSKK